MTTKLDLAFDHANAFLKHQKSHQPHIIDVMQYFGKRREQIEKQYTDHYNDPHRDITTQEARAYLADIQVLKTAEQFMFLLLERSISPEDQARRMISGELHLSHEQIEEKYNQPLPTQAQELKHLLEQYPKEPHMIRPYGYKMEDLEIFLSYLK